MDPLTQFALGAVAAQAAFGKRLGHRAWLVGGCAGAAPDLDIFIRSASDPLFAIEMHRQFTHSLAFIPFGGALAALPWLLARKARVLWKPLFAASITGYATHGLLDACTTYGTQLLWPFSDARIGWDNVAIIDPLVTLPLLAGMALAAKLRNVRPAQTVLVFALAYLAFGSLQNQRALDAQARIAAARGHVITRGEAFPSIGSNLLWRSLYSVRDATGETYFADRIRVGWTGEVSWHPSGDLRAINPEIFAATPARIRQDFQRFAHFSDGWVALDPTDPTVYADARYSLDPRTFAPIWGVRFDATAAVPTVWVNRTSERRLPLAALWHEMTGQAQGFDPLPSRADEW